MTNEFRQALEILQGQSYEILHIVMQASSTVAGISLFIIVITGFIKNKYQNPNGTRFPKTQKASFIVLMIAVIVLFSSSFVNNHQEESIYKGIRAELLEQHGLDDIRFIPEPSKEWIDAFRDSNVGSEIIVKENNRVQYYNLWLSGDEISLEKIPQRFMV